MGTRINPVLVVSDVLGYIFNWFWGRPFVKKGGVVIILNPVFEFFHPQYHAAYRRFYDEVLRETADPFEMRERFQEKFARDPDLVDAYRNRWAHHGFHPFTVWYWATYPLKYLSRVILVGPPERHHRQTIGCRVGAVSAPRARPGARADRRRRDRRAQRSTLHVPVGRRRPLALDRAFTIPVS